MGELLIFLIVLLSMSIFDILKMKKANLKKEIVPYLVLTLFSGAIGLAYFLSPDGPSISKMLFELFNIKE